MSADDRNRMVARMETTVVVASLVLAMILILLSAAERHPQEALAKRRDPRVSR